MSAESSSPTPSPQTTLAVGGMTCGGCVRRVTEVIGQQGGRDVVVDLANGQARFSASAPQVEAIRRALDADGWEVRP